MWCFDEYFIKLVAYKSVKMLLSLLCYRLFLIIGTTIIVTTIIYYNFTYNLTKSYYKLFNSDTQSNKTIKYILLWNSFFNRQNWYLGDENITTFGKEYFKSISCDVTNCVITTQHDYLADQIDYDAVIFHSYDVWSLINPIPKTRSPSQIYIMAIQESPENTRHNFDKDIDFFNWTMTYKLGSDILYPYKYFVDVDTKRIMAPSNTPNWKPYDDNFFDVDLLKLSEKKTKSIAWFVSHCRTTSRREYLVKQISRFMMVDIYGQCGSLTCTDAAKCDQMLDTDYKFYLSFENSLCPDYVTEKLFNNLERYIIPIVYGGSDYSKFAPPKSYINVNDFKTVPDLMNYLKYLDDNPKEYIKYFWWKKYYTLVGGPDRTFCDVCKKLNEPNLPVKMYSNLSAWWSGCYRKSNIEF